MDATSESGRSEDPFYIVEFRRWVQGGTDPRTLVPRTLQLGAVLTGEVLIQPVTTWPLVISAGWDRKLVNMNGCVDSDEKTYAPFCGWARFDELRLGIGVVF
jgi:hypothetical protein